MEWEIVIIIPVPGGDDVSFGLSYILQCSCVPFFYSNVPMMQQSAVIIFIFCSINHIVYFYGVCFSISTLINILVVNIVNVIEAKSTIAKNWYRCFKSFKDAFYRAGFPDFPCLLISCPSKANMAWNCC